MTMRYALNPTTHRDQHDVCSSAHKSAKRYFTQTHTPKNKIKVREGGEIFGKPPKSDSTLSIGMKEQHVVAFRLMQFPSPEIIDK